MKDYRLDHKDWYDKNNDLVQCLYCLEWKQSINSNHLKTHGFKKMSDYKKEYGILPNTPLQNKAMLTKKQEHAIRMREQGILNVYKKGETGIPIEHQKGDTHKFYKGCRSEYADLLSRSLVGVKKSRKHCESMRAGMLSSPKRHQLKDMGYSYREGRADPKKGLSFEDVFGKRRANIIRKKMSETRKEKINSGLIIPCGPWTRSKRF